MAIKLVDLADKWIALMSKYFCVSLPVWGWGAPASKTELNLLKYRKDTEHLYHAFVYSLV